MAYAITLKDSLQPTVYATQLQITDQTVTPTAGDLLKKYNKFKATVFLKVATAASIVSLEVSSSATFASDIVKIATVSFIITAVQSAVLEGVAPDGARQHARLTQSGAGTLDAIIEAGL